MYVNKKRICLKKSSLQVLCSTCTVSIKKLICVCGNHFHYCVISHYKWSSRRHKSSSRRSISKTAQQFGNLCEYKHSAFFKKPSNLQGSCTANAHLEKCAKGQCHFLYMYLSTNLLCTRSLAFSTTLVSQ